MAEYTLVRRNVIPAMGAKVGPASATVVMPLTWDEVVSIRKEDPHHTLYVIPFGPARGMVVVREAGKMDWKLKKGEKFWEWVKLHPHIGEKGVGLAAGLKKAIAISKAYKGTTGVVFINGIPYPRKAIAQKNWTEKSAEVSKIEGTLKY